MLLPFSIVLRLEKYLAISTILKHANIVKIVIAKINSPFVNPAG